MNFPLQFFAMATASSRGCHHHGANEKMLRHTGNKDLQISKTSWGFPSFLSYFRNWAITAHFSKEVFTIIKFRNQEGTLYAIDGRNCEDEYEGGFKISQGKKSQKYFER